MAPTLLKGDVLVVAKAGVRRARGGVGTTSPRTAGHSAIVTTREPRPRAEQNKTHKMHVRNRKNTHETQGAPPAVGDIVVFSQPPALRRLLGDSVPSGDQFVKRVAAAAGGAPDFESRVLPGAPAACAEPSAGLVWDRRRLMFSKF